MTTQYFAQEPEVKSSPMRFNLDFHGKRCTFDTDTGVFSPTHADPETLVLVETVLNDKRRNAYEALSDVDESIDDIDELFYLLGKAIGDEGNLLDLGCGYGLVGVLLAQFFEVDVTFSDINTRAVSLAQKNARQNGVKTFDAVCSDGFWNLHGEFDIITLNPPIHAGKETVYRLYEEAHDYCRGALYVVIAKKHGAESSFRRLTELYEEVTVIYKKSGLFVFKCQV